MNLVQTIVLSLSLVSLLSCVAAEDGDGRSLPIRSLARGAFSGIKQAEEKVIKTSEEWEKLWKEHSVSAHQSGKIPAVDFTKEMVIAVTMGTKRTGGYAIEITGVERTDKSLRIVVKKTSPPPGTFAIQALTAPFQFVAVPKSDLKPEFIEFEASSNR